MKFNFTEIKDCKITSMQVTPTGAIKKIWIDCFCDTIDLTGLNLDTGAEIQLNCIIRWEEPK